MPYQPTLNFKLSDGRDLGSLGWITKEYLMSVYPQIANQLITPELWVWGRNDAGALGDNTTTSRYTPVTTFAGGANWRQVAGNRHTAAIKTDGTLWVWGRNYSSPLGTNDTTDRPTPVTTFAGGTNWRQVACGYTVTAAIKTDGTLWVWGRNAYRQLGTNDTTDRPTPVTTFAGGTNWRQVACGSQHTAAIKTDGTLWIWGANGADGRLGNNTSNATATPITTFAGGTNWKQVAGGQGHTTAIKTDGTLWTWGSNFAGQLGDNTATNRLTPVTTFAGGTDWKQVSCGDSFTAAIKTNGTLWTWGQNVWGVLGINGTGNDRSTPITTFAGGTNWKQLTCSAGAYIGAIKTDGTLWNWGLGSNGQLGDNIQTQRITPVTTFLGGTSWKQVSGGNTHILAIRTSDNLQGI